MESVFLRMSAWRFNTLSQSEGFPLRFLFVFKHMKYAGKQNA